MRIVYKIIIICWITSFVILSSCSKKDIVIDDTGMPPIEEEPPSAYDPGDPSAIEKDMKILPKRASASERQPGTDIQKSIDGDKTTLYHSRWGNGTQYPVELDYFFEGDEQIDYFVLYPRSDGNDNGWIVTATVYIKGKGEGEYTKYKDYNFKKSATPKIISFPEGFKNPAAIRISVTEGVNHFVSLAEIEFYRKNIIITESLDIFADKAATRLKEGLTEDVLQGIQNAFIKNMALAMYHGVYDTMRINTYKSYPDPRTISNQNKTGPYGIYDNVTGIFVKDGTEMVVFIDDFDGEISFRVVNHNEGFGGVDFALQPGLNRFIVNTEGLAYLIFQNNRNEEVRANIATGILNGYFDIKKHSNDDWDELIGDASYSHFDLLGKLSHLTLTTDDLRKYTDDIEKLIGLYDDLVEIEQDFIGLYKYDRANNTRMYFRTNTHEDMFMYASTYRTEYTRSTMSLLCDPDALKSTPWGPAHEVGHINQTRPGFRWLGMTEVTNNVYTLYVQTSWGNKFRLNVEKLNKYNNRYEKGFTELLNQKAHALEGDVFVKLIPFWQLQLYMAQVLGKGDFYKDVHEAIRVNDNPELPGENQVEFVKIVSDVAQLDLTEFFKAWGFLTPGSFDLDDYGKGNLTVTQKMVDDAIEYIQSKAYPVPDDAIRYIHEESIDLYKNHGTLVPGSATVSGNTISIAGSQNATVFLLERDGSVVFVSPGSVFTPDSVRGSDTLYAVGYDGEKKKVEVK